MVKNAELYEEYTFHIYRSKITRMFKMQKRIFALIYLLIVWALAGAYAQEIIYQVKKGETLYSISRKYKVSLDNILILNNIEDSSKIKSGFKLKIPQNNTSAKISKATEEYKVGKGETLYGIAKKHKVSVNDIINENNLNKKGTIYPGQTIKIPRTQSQHIVVSAPSTTGRNKPAKQIVSRSSSYYWPVDGEMEKLSGKLKGSTISAKFGEIVYSVSSGKVVWEGPYRGFGRVIFVESKSGYVYVYGGNEKTSVNVGDSVEPGLQLGKIGHNSYAGKSAMFFAVYKDGKAVDVEKAPRM